MRAALCTGLYAILDQGNYAELLALGERLLALELSALQIRAKSLTAPERAALARALKNSHAAKRAAFPLIINDDISLAKELGCGLHLGQGDGPSAPARAALGEQSMLGRSTHDLAQVREANCEQIDYVGYGPIYPTRSKADAHPARGLTDLVAVLEATALPVVAIGGITFENVSPLIEIGIRHVAMLSALHIDDLEWRVAALQAWLRSPR